MYPYSKIRLFISKVLSKYNRKKFSTITAVSNKERVIEFYSSDDKRLYSLGRLDNGEFFILINNVPYYAFPSIFDAARLTSIGKDLCIRLGLNEDNLQKFLYTLFIFKKNRDCVIAHTTREGVHILACPIPGIFEDNPYAYLKSLMENMSFDEDEVIRYTDIKKLNETVVGF